MPARKPLGVVPSALLGTGLVAVAVLDCIVLVSLWPVVEPVPEGETAATSWSLFAWDPWTISRDTAFLLLVVVASVLGSFVHAATSFATYAGNRRLYGSWVWWYLLRNAIGAALAVIVYFAVRGGLFTASATSDSLNTYGVAAIAGMTGLFSKQATDKLRELFDTLLATASRTGDEERSDKITNPAPILAAIEPDRVETTDADVELNLAGSGFIASTTIVVSRAEPEELTRTLPIRLVSAQSAAVTMPAEFLADAGVVNVTAQNPSPGGGDSETLELIVAEA